jgi:hypothetical protein
MSAGLTQLIRPLALLMLIKNLGRHSLPPLGRILSRDSTTRLERSLPSWQGLQGEKDTSSYTSRYREFRWNKRYKVHSSLPQRCSWGSGWWMCIWIANSRQIPPAMPRYIPTSVQRTLVQYSTSMTKRFGHDTCKFGHRTFFYDQLMTKLNWSQKLHHIWSTMTNWSFWS